MKLRHIKIVFLLTVLLVSVLSLCSCFDFDQLVVDLGFYQKNTKANEKFTVVVRETDGVRISGDSVKEVSSGQKVVFNVTIDEDNYVYLGNTAEAYYDPEKKTITVSRVDSPLTIDFILVDKSELYCVNVYSNISSYYIKFEKGSEWMVEPEEVTLKATEPEGFTFQGWSVGDYIDNMGTVVEYSTEYTFTPDSKVTNIYANYSSESQYKIAYDANGGSIANFSGTKYTVVGNLSPLFPMQQTLNENHSSIKFVREGYTAIGYSTEKTTDYRDYTSVNDIEGFSNMGGVCQVPESGLLTLNVVWAENTPEADFTVEPVTYTDVYSEGGVDGKGYVTRSGCIITRCNVKSDTVVIPETINGMVVIGIKAGAFSGNVLQKVVIPKTVLKIEANAFTNSYRLREVVFFDSLQYVSNSSFPFGVQTVVMNAQRLPVYSGSAEGSFCIKYERVRTLEGKKLIVVSGSSTLNGLNSPMLEANFDNEYSVVNYGTNAGTQMLFYLDVISNYINPGDIVIHAPEWTSDGPMGGNTLQWKMFRGNNQCYDIFREVNMSEYTNFWGAYQEYQIGAESHAVTRKGVAYQNSNTGMNKYGDLLGNRYNYNGFSYNSTQGFSESFITSNNRASNLNRVNSRITSKGGTMLFSFGTILYEKLNTSSRNANAYDTFTQQCANALDFPVISNVGTYLFKERYMSNSEWHCTYEGADIRTEELTFDIKRWLSSSGTGDTYQDFNTRKSNNSSSYQDGM